MQFSWPGLGDILYRLWRLRRLIVACAMVPTIAFGTMALTGLSGVGAGTSSFVSLALVLLALVSMHTVLFPNSNQETAAISLTLTVLAIVAPIIAGSFFGWFVFLLFALWMIWSGQQRILTWQVQSKTHSPVFTARVKVAAPLEHAREFFPLRPGLKRGAFTCGSVEPDGRFPVWYDTGQADWLAAMGLGDLPSEAEFSEFDGAEIADALGMSGRGPLGDPSFFARIEEDTPSFQRTLILESGPDDAIHVQSIVEHQFEEKGASCIVTESDAATTFPKGQSLFMWLADFQMDGLIQNRDLLLARETRAIRATHHLSLLAMFTGWILRRFMQRSLSAGVTHEERVAAASAEVSEKLAALLNRLGPDYQTKGFTSGPIPLVTLEEFFDGNDDDGSFQGAHVETARHALLALRNRDDVADIRLGITQWDGPTTWPLAEYMYFVTTAQIADVKSWLKDANIWVDEVSTNAEHHPREEINVPAGHRIVWAWID